MDATDLVLSKLLLSNSRLSYRELADRLDLSVNAVHRRVQALSEQGVIRAFTAKISLQALNGVPLIVFGRSGALSSGSWSTIGAHESTYWLGVAGGNSLYVGAYLRHIDDLEAYVAFVRKEARMPTPTVGLELHGTASPLPQRPHEPPLYPLDYQIIYALYTNARRPLSEVAEALGVSARTVRRRLTAMLRGGLIDLSMDWYPDASNDVMTVFHLYLSASATKSAASALLQEKYSAHTVFFWSFSNLPTQLIGIMWTNTMMQLRDLHHALQSEPFFTAVVPNILYTGYIFDTWRDAFLHEHGVPPRR